MAAILSLPQCVKYHTYTSYMWWHQPIWSYVSKPRLKFFGTHLNWIVSYIAYTKFHLPRSVFHSLGQIFSRIGEQASTSFPAWKPTDSPTTMSQGLCSSLVEGGQALTLPSLGAKWALIIHGTIDWKSKAQWGNWLKSDGYCLPATWLKCYFGVTLKS